MQRSRRKCESTSMGSIVLDLRPGLGIGPFSLGMPICEAFAQIEQQPNIYDVVHVKYYDEEPLKLDIVISFPDHGFHLRFDPWSQLIFPYRGPSTLATFVAVYALFGPTYPGVYDKDRSVYTLFYPVSLVDMYDHLEQYFIIFFCQLYSWQSLMATFCRDCHLLSQSPHNMQIAVITEKVIVLISCSALNNIFDAQCLVFFSSSLTAELPLEFPDGTTPVTCRVSVYDSSTDRKVGVGSSLVKACVPPLAAGSLYMEEVQVKVKYFLPLSTLGEELWFTVGSQHIPFGASPQTHKIKKFVLHTNYPGHSDFNSYMKCNFVICISDYGGSLHQNVNTSKCAITPSTKWEQVKEILGDSGRAAIQTQGSTSNPFGSTFVYGYPNVAFEEHALLVYGEIMKL
ncbi:hypothetical protein DH2020_015508 [Rehmannia glutinosa]|uniref:Uncharacterized protein n=1 Tax=Rehmannia glutinosa TaxID=99300 RepID=A0ABR0WTG4_REHGL